MSTLDVWSYPGSVLPTPPPEALGRVALVAGGRQGVGVSTLAALLGLVEEGEVLIVEADDHGVSHRIFGAPRPERFGGGTDTLDFQPTPVLDRLSVLSIAGAEPRLAARRLAHLRKRYALVIVDAGSRLQVAREVAAAGIDHLLCVTTSDAVATAGAYAMLKALGGRTPAVPAGILVNRAPLWAATEVDHYLRQAASRFLGREIEIISHIPMDECLRAGLRAGMPLHEVAVGSPAAHALYEVGQSLHPMRRHLSPPVFAPRPLQRRS